MGLVWSLLEHRYGDSQERAHNVERVFGTPLSDCGIFFFSGGLVDVWSGLLLHPPRCFRLGAKRKEKQKLHLKNLSPLWSLSPLFKAVLIGFLNQTFFNRLCSRGRCMVSDLAFWPKQAEMYKEN